MQFGVRAPMGKASYSFDEEFDGANYDGELELGGIGLLGDFYPFRGGITTDINAKVEQKRDLSPYAGLGYPLCAAKTRNLPMKKGALAAAVLLSLSACASRPAGAFLDGRFEPLEGEAPLTPEEAGMRQE